MELPAAGPGQPERALPRIFRLGGTHPTVSLEQCPDARECRALQAESFGQLRNPRRALERQSGEDGKLGRAKSMRAQLLFEEPGDRSGMLSGGETVTVSEDGEFHTRAHEMSVYTPVARFKSYRRIRGGTPTRTAPSIGLDRPALLVYV